MLTAWITLITTRMCNHTCLDGTEQKKLIMYGGKKEKGQGFAAIFEKKKKEEKKKKQNKTNEKMRIILGLEHKSASAYLPA